jgi:hypothetical protein
MLTGRKTEARRTYRLSILLNQREIDSYFLEIPIRMFFAGPRIPGLTPILSCLVPTVFVETN